MAFMKRIVVGWALAALQGVAGAQVMAPQAPATGPLADSIFDRARLAIFWADWDELERLDLAARADTTRSREGWLAICQFRGAFVMRDSNPSAGYHASRVAGTLDWARRRPELTLAHVAHVQALVELAWFHRGAGPAGSVAEQRLADMRATLERAQAYADKHLAAQMTDPHVAVVMLGLLRGRFVGADQQLALVRRGLRGEPFDECLYDAAVPSLMPSWGSSPLQLDAWVSEAMRGLSGADAALRYVMLYSAAANSEYRQSLFERTAAPWPVMREHLKQVVAAYPQGRFWRNRLAYFACMAKDREAAVDALRGIDKPDVGAWGEGGPQRNYNACRQWALQS